MIIVSGWLRVKAEDRAPYLESCQEVIAAARAAPGNIDFHLSADPIDDERINVFEQWEGADAVAAFRTQATRHWYKALRRRSQRTRLNWARMNRLATRSLPTARMKHPFPSVRCDARTQGRSPLR